MDFKPVRPGILGLISSLLSTVPTHIMGTSQHISLMPLMFMTNFCIQMTMDYTPHIKQYVREGRVILCVFLVTHSYPALCNPMDCSLPGSSVHGDFPGKNTGVGCHALLQRAILGLGKTNETITDG